jgi:hypothetical protein
MRTSSIQIGAETANWHMGFNAVTANRESWGGGIPLVCAFLVMLGGLSVQAGTEGTDKLAANSKADISGVYALVTVNGLKLPAKISHEGAVLEVRSGTFTITADGKCTSKMTFVPPSGREATVNTRATYTPQGPSLNMQWEGAGTTTGTVNGNTFTMENEGMVFVYSKAAGAAKAAKIGAAEAKDHYNESLVVTGQVVQVSFRPTIVYLNLDKPYPETPFAAAVFAKDTNSFGDLSKLKGKGVEVRGTIKEYRGRAQIVLEHTNQLVVVGGR